MMIRHLIIVAALLITVTVNAENFNIVSSNTKVSVVYDSKGPTIDSITAHLLAEDIQRVTGYLPAVLTDISKAKGTAIIIGNIHSKLIQSLISNQTSFYKNIAAKWECYGLKILNNPGKNVSTILIVAGSDNRGTAYGVFDISERIGVTPWYWWADVHPVQQRQLSLNVNEFISTPPSVKYRGIFINDEDWGLQPWAAKTFEPETGDIGPKTYAKVFELLLRLKANLIWPAMHPSTKAFYSYLGNKKVAAEYSIIIGSSHAEPMLRNNVGEWNEKTMGAFNYITNKEKVYTYWEDRIKKSSGNDAIYTIGMRGVHDSGIEGVKTPKEAVPLLEQIFKDQRMMLQKYVNKDVTKVPQVFTVYKEVLDIYDSNLKLPDDVTLVWPDDNYGYIQRLNNEKEKQRQGGSGVYYHASYWGRPHDYLWLSTTNPALIREEMMKAYETKADKLWVLNVGDIKPLEYNIQMFMDMAYNAGPFKDSRYVKTHMLNWANRIFGNDKGIAIQNILTKYYRLAFERRPEFMGWSQTEPTTKTSYTDYNHFYYGDEAQQRIDKYEALEKQVRNLRKQINKENDDAYYQLVFYPVVCASFMNKKFLYRDKSYLYAKQNRLSAFDYAVLSKNNYDSIVSETNYYNNNLANGKWKNIMSMKPRDLPVYQLPVLPEINIERSGVWSVAPEGYDTSAASTRGLTLPAYNFGTNQKCFIDIFLNDDKTVNWKATTSSNWINLSELSGTLSPQFGKKQMRVWVSIDWTKALNTNSKNGVITFNAGDKQVAVNITTLPKPNKVIGYKDFIENNGYVSINASNYSRQTNNSKYKWQLVDGLGQTGNSIEVLPLTMPPFNNNESSIKNFPCVEYDFYVLSSAAPEVSFFTLPTLPLNKDYGVRYAVAIDDSPLKIVDFKTVGRSEEWKQNVLRNSAIKKVNFPALNKGRHVLKVYAIDPGVMLDKIIINLGGLQKAYSNIPETKTSN